MNITRIEQLVEQFSFYIQAVVTVNIAAGMICVAWHL